MRFLKTILVLFIFLFGASYITKAQETQDGVSEIVVSGVVYDAASKLPLPFAEISCEGYASTFGGDEGEFDIHVRSLLDRIVVKLPGYHTQEVILAGRNSVEVYLQFEDRPSTQENVSYGYYQEKSLYTTKAVASSSAPFIGEVVGKKSPESAFGAGMSGVQFKTKSGVLNASSDIFVRGANSLNATNQPLIIVDGMIFDINEYGNSMMGGYVINPLAGIAIDDIESVNVVKDAVAIYGAKAANGVVYITTKRAREQVTTIELQAMGGLNLMPNRYPLLNGSEYKSYLQDMILNAGDKYEDIYNVITESSERDNPLYYAYNNETDWQKEIFRRSFNTAYRLNIKGGDDIALYSLSAGFAKDEGNVLDSDYSKFDLRFNSDINFSKWFTLNSNISFAYQDKNIGGTGANSPEDVINISRIKSPFLHQNIINEEGIKSFVLSDYDILGVSNPIAILDKQNLRDVNYRFFGSFNFNINFNKYFTVSNLVGISFDKDRETIFLPSYGVSPEVTSTGTITNRMKARVVRYMSLNNDLRGLYKRKFNYAHEIKALAGVRININTNEEDWGADYTSANDMIRTLGNGLGVLRQKGGYLGEWNSMTMYASVGYDYSKKYFLNGEFALDGSSRYGAEADGVNMFNSIFGVFPSVSAAWLVTSEPFMNDVDFIDVLKVRASYGLTGNDDIGNYSGIKYYSPQSMLSYQGILQGNLYNPELKWETNTKTNVGLDLALLNERIYLSVDLFSNKVEDMIDFVPASLYSGFEHAIVNDGSMTTQGLDVNLGVQVLNKPFMWDLNFAISTYKTEVNSIHNNKKVTELFGANILTEVGGPLGVFYGYKTDGVYSTTEEAQSAGLYTRLPNTQLIPFEAGDVRFVNVNSDDNIINSEDMVVIGDPTPDFYGSITSRMKWKGIELDAIFSYSLGNDVYNYQRRKLESMSNLDNQLSSTINRWMYEGQVTDMPRMSYGDQVDNNRFSDRWIEDGSYLRLSNITLSYELPYKPLGIQNIGVYVAGNNLLTISGYKGLDPMFSGGSYALMNGIDLGLLPQTKSILFGIKIGL